MGHLLYGSPAEAFEIDDRSLAHLQVVIINKLRRNESFFLTLDRDDAADVAREGVWMHPSIQVRFRFSEMAKPELNRAWCEALMTEANSGRGLSLVDEADATPTPLRSVGTDRRRVAA